MYLYLFDHMWGIVSDEVLYCLDGIQDIGHFNLEENHEEYHIIINMIYL